MTQTVKELAEEIQVYTKEVIFWLKRAAEIEVLIDNIDGYALGSNNLEEKYVKEYAEILTRLVKEKDSLEKFRVKYNKEAKKRGMKEIPFTI